MHLLPLILYACAAGAYLAHFAGRDRSVGRLATGLLGGGGPVAHVHHRHADGAGRARAAGRHDGGGVGVRVAARPGLPLRRAHDGRAGHGRLVTALLAVLDVIPALDPGVSPRPAVLQSPLFTLHVLAMLFAYASFALAGVLGVTYVLLFKEIKAKHLGFFYARLPSLQVARRDERPRR